MIAIGFYGEFSIEHLAAIVGHSHRGTLAQACDGLLRSPPGREGLNHLRNSANMAVSWADACGDAECW
ncbi:hypothetical protein MILUP08_45782 [Micromonospora lupini str. Lupac 08]|uniref:Uncharacterized protein n=1 Tax=Micromonospora lupini str. Lupac 08 TaxID=1150864 RepID=I0LAP2_9ACTN|nr:hypothetical protein MILUP08_45782 [Micromonospora lupini str. Lupac 08]